MVWNEISKTCCFIGHRTINETEELKDRIRKTIEDLIVNEKVACFLFGSKSRFDSLCLEIVSDLRKKYPQIRRVYMRAEYPVIDEGYLAYLLEGYEETYYPEKLLGAGKAVYVERNYEMIDRSAFCVAYYDAAHAPQKRKSGTKLAYEYAVKKDCVVLNLA